ncbi:MAG: mannitol dehydrogenase family protein [Pseudomonadota bacterium]
MLHHLPTSVEVPRYRRDQLSPGIVHIGVGNFHRAHQAWYLHRLMQQGLAYDWAIVGAGVRPADTEMRDKLLAQDCLTTLIELAPYGSRAEVIGSLIDYVPVGADNRALIAAMTAQNCRIVSLTVTEGGYYIDTATGAFDADHPDIRHDANKPSEPRTAFGAIVAALRHRREAGLGPFTVLSCDNLQGNGGIARQVVVSLASFIDPDLSCWIDTQCSFPNSMVDSIVPATGPHERSLAASLGVVDQVPVTHENFRQRVIEDDFCAGRPDWDQVGATFTDNVHGYEAMKLRILNGGHQVLANAGELLGVPTIDRCISHPQIGAFFVKVQNDEILPHVVDVPGLRSTDYLSRVVCRFSNPAVKDTTRRVAFDGSARHTGFILPVLRDAVKIGTPIEGLALTEALWARMCAGTRDDGSEIEPNDPKWSQLRRAAIEAQNKPSRWLDQTDVYGDLASNRRFSAAFDKWLKTLWEVGTFETLNQYITM